MEFYMELQTNQQATFIPRPNTFLSLQFCMSVLTYMKKRQKKTPFTSGNIVNTSLHGNISLINVSSTLFFTSLYNYR